MGAFYRKFHEPLDELENHLALSCEWGLRNFYTTIIPASMRVRFYNYIANAISDIISRN